MATATASKLNFTFKLDRTLRDQFSSVCDGLGISMSAALTAFVKQTIRQQGVSFSLLDENGFNAAAYINTPTNVGGTFYIGGLGIAEIVIDTETCSVNE